MERTRAHSSLHRMDGLIMNHTTHLDTTHPRLARAVEQGARAAIAALRQLAAEWSRRRLARQTLHALQTLDSRTLRDLGLDRSETVSVVAELSGDAEVTRARLLLAVHSRPF